MKNVLCLFIALKGLLLFSQEALLIPKSDNILFIGKTYEMAIWLKDKTKIEKVTSNDYFKVTPTDSKNTVKVTPLKKGTASFQLTTSKGKVIESNSYQISEFPIPRIVINGLKEASKQPLAILKKAKEIELYSDLNIHYPYTLEAYIIEQILPDGSSILKYKKKGNLLNGKAAELIQKLQSKQTLKIRAKITAPNGSTLYSELLIGVL